ncbi:hypothetical protein [Leucobacter komagatae]|uniref:hypothetical protein n=1 Tax=Leucobacter komagatae TaxID=55969 RepID=UPI000B311B12
MRALRSYRGVRSSTGVDPRLHLGDLETCISKEPSHLIHRPKISSGDRVIEFLNPMSFEESEEQLSPRRKTTGELLEGRGQ